MQKASEKKQKNVGSENNFHLRRRERERKKEKSMDR